MTQGRLLITGMVLVAVGLIGMSLQAPAGGRWGMPMGSMMGWRELAHTTTDQALPVAGAPTIEVEATEFAFQPDRLVIDAGGTVNLTLVNRGGLVHDLSIPELDVHLVAASEETTTTGLEVSEAGEYPMVCTVPGHAEAGMIGLIVVQAG
jgi:plastocyanin